ncbi:hypothetical protein PPSIR1_05208 [Plesiocystis pacifica SIR-1]|uniref:Methyltransferase type 11 domain-containing protein n=1 Tax=Plesiocystis pacifica SIR-1 TaxID=391625 RepID=A6FX14_9BACT|nr:PhzF family phenazine biosynthesis isomerase [Plesiocystis pacifica]EDM81838.1 hypothetical protein PPSIR1_05208 [Plesiocystis pacifica SIR-1]
MSDETKASPRDPRALREANRASWNVATAAHNRHKRDQAAWLRAGGELLFPEDYALLGPLEGAKLLHLQCNSGQDTVCLARAGASVTGVDISDEAIAFARGLASELEQALGPRTPSFERADIYDWLPTARAAGRRFDKVYSSYGVICWLPDLRAWAEGIAGVLRPGGTFVLVEFHPFMQCFDETGARVFPYLGAARGEVLSVDEGVSDYVGESGAALAPTGFVPLPEGEAFTNPNPCHEFAWSLADLFGALRDAGLRVEAFEEHPHCNGWRCFDDLVLDPDNDRRWVFPPGQPTIPLTYGLRARKPGLPLARVDAFVGARGELGGNPAGVCVLERPEDLGEGAAIDARMQAIAADNNLSETAFVWPTSATGERWRIRWFTPTTEVDLCGHATLASAHVLFEAAPHAELRLDSRSGELVVRRGGEGAQVLDFPAELAEPETDAGRIDALVAALGLPAGALVSVARASYWLVIVDSAQAVAALRPDFAAVLAIAPGEVIVSAPGPEAAGGDGVDFVSRFFGPGVGIDEDPVTGSAHCILAPYWAAQLGKDQLRARQLSARGGLVDCKVLRGPDEGQASRVELTGHCRVTLRGELTS